MTGPVYKKTAAFSLLTVFALSTFLLFFRLGDRTLRNPDEGRYAEIAREMAVSRDWLEPTLYGTDYLSKPVLFYWLMAASFKLFGTNEFSARLIPALFGLLGILATYIFTRRLLGGPKAYFASLILATNLFYLEISRYLVIDAVFSFFLTGVFFLAYFAAEEKKQNYVLAFYGFLGLAFLAKGLAGIAIPALALLAYLAATRQLRAGVRCFFSVKGLALFLAVTLPWLVAISVHEPEFLKFFFWHEHFGRYLTADFPHQEPWYFYLPLLPLIFFPWSIFASPLKDALNPKRRSSQNLRLYLQVVLFSIVIFYSLSRSKLVTYLMPAIPVGSILLGDAWLDWVEREAPAQKIRKSNVLTIGLAFLFMLSAVFAVFSPLFGLSFPSRIPETVRFYVFLALILIFAESGILIFCVLRRHRKALFYSWIVFLSLASLLAASIMEPLNQNYTTRHFAEFLKPRLSAEDTVFIYGQPGAFYDFAFYLDRPVKLVGLEGELEANLEDYEAEEEELKQAVVMRDAWLRLLEKEKVFCLMRQSDYAELGPDVKGRLTILMQDDRKVLLKSGAVPI